MVVGGRGGSWMVARFSNACYLFIFLLVTHLPESQQKSNINFRTLYNLHPQDQSWVLVPLSNWQCFLQFQNQINFRLPCTSVYGNFISSISLVQSRVIFSKFSRWLARDGWSLILTLIGYFLIWSIYFNAVFVSSVNIFFKVVTCEFYNSRLSSLFIRFTK